MKKLPFSLVLFMCLACLMSQTILFAQPDAGKQFIPIGGNAWVNDGAAIANEGLVNWSNPQAVCQIYFRLNQPGELRLSVVWKTDSQATKIKLSLAGKSVELNSQGSGEKEYPAGTWNISEAGYVTVLIQGLTRAGADFGTLKSLVVSGSAVSAEMAYVKNNKDNYFLWGRRGPSVHLRYDTGNAENTEWFYSEIKVPQNYDVIGSYFMANGFAEGYFGMQVNSSTERKVLFSVWSPYTTDNPGAIPEDQKIVLLKKGTGVHIGEFGNEGSGGQSYLLYNWKAETTYKFLLRGVPAAGNYTAYTAYFYAPEENKWLLIASFKRPKTHTYLKSLYSFVENFNPEQGNLKRMAYYGNQWVVNTKGEWTELTKTTFTGDETANKNFRKDYAGGINGSSFYLRNGAFFNNFTKLNQVFTRKATNEQPMIDFSKLP